MIWMLILALQNISEANEQSISVGFGTYYGGAGIAYTYSPTIGFGFQIGAGQGGVALGARWQPQWMSGGYAQAGVTSSYPGTLAPNMVVGGIIGNEVFLDVNIGIQAIPSGLLLLASDIGLGLKF